MVDYSVLNQFQSSADNVNDCVDGFYSQRSLLMPKLPSFLSMYKLYRIYANSKAVTCDNCLRWHHIRCGNTGISAEMYDAAVVNGEELQFMCRSCIDMNVDENGDISNKQVALNGCVGDLTALMEGRQLYSTHIENSSDVVQVDGRYEYMGHLLTNSSVNLDGIKKKFLDSLLNNINKRFPQKQLLDAFFVLCLRTINVDSDPNFGDSEIEVLLNHFGEEKTYGDVTSPTLLNKDTVRKEWRLVKEIVRSLKYSVDSFEVLRRLLTESHAKDVPNMIKLAQFAAVLPLHTANCERVFSQQNKIITKHMCKLSSDNLDKLLKIWLATEELNFQEVLRLWKQNKNRRIFKK